MHSIRDHTDKSSVRRAQHSASRSARPMETTQQANAGFRPGLRSPIRGVAGNSGLPRSTSTPTRLRETGFPAPQDPSAQVRVETPLVCEQGMPKVVGYLGNTCCSQFDSSTIPAALLPAAGPATIPQQRFFQQRFLQWLTRHLPPLLPVHLISGVKTARLVYQHQFECSIPTMCQYLHVSYIRTLRLFNSLRRFVHHITRNLDILLTQSLVVVYGFYSLIGFAGVRRC